jgi:hypothetical protein
MILIRIDYPYLRVECHNKCNQNYIHKQFNSIYCKQLTVRRQSMRQLLVTSS